MKKRETLVNLQTIINLQKPNYDNSFSNLPSQDQIKFRRDRVNRLNKQGNTNKEIAKKIGCSLATIEKDFNDIRHRSKQWFEKESIVDFCESLYDGIILCDNAIEDLFILYGEYDDLDSKIKILNTISDFEERKTKLYQKTESVQNYLKKNRSEDSK